jgi:diaminopimelate epimerase
MAVIPPGRQFYKMTGSGNDFVFIDVRNEPPGELERAKVIREICARGSGIGADGIVFLGVGREAEVALRYLNSDGSLAALCGNATLCTARLAAELDIVGYKRDFTIETDSGPVRARFRDGVPEIDLQPVTEFEDCFQTDLMAGELRMGFALVGVPHLVVRCRDVDQAHVVERGRQLRQLPELAHGANVNFVSKVGGSWCIRTYERGVEAETLACGTGTVATALLLSAWGEAPDAVVLRSRSGRSLHVRHQKDVHGWLPSLSGEARIVFVGQLREYAPATV